MEIAKAGGVLVICLTAEDLRDPVGVHEVFEEQIVDRQEKRILVDLSGIEMLTSL